MIVVILAGGEGQRLWPLSTKSFPKQFLHFGKKESLLQKTYKRFRKSKVVTDILIVTNSKYVKLVESELENIDSSSFRHIIVEPYKKNTAPAILLAIKYIKEKLKQNDAKILISPSDHYISNENDFLCYLEKLEKKDFKAIVTFGVTIENPVTGYGYIKIENKKDDLLYSVSKFIEKPSIENAKKYLKDKKYFWNSGIFLFKIKTFLLELKTHLPNFYKMSKLSYKELFNNFKSMESISIDYALMEKTKKILICPLKDIFWSDVGSWDSVYDVLEKDNNLNAFSGNVLDINTKNSLVIGGKKLISTIGLENMLIVETENAIFIAKKGESQKVRELLEKLKKR